jgi:hypothetical protein
MRHIYIILQGFITVLDIRSQYIPEVVVVRRGAIGVWGAGEGGGGSTGWGVQAGSVYKQPEEKKGSSCHIWREPSKWKGTQRGKKGELTEGTRGARGTAPCIYKHDVCARVIE